MRRLLHLLVTLFVLCCGAQQLPPADVADASYGPHERNVLDLWKARSERPTPLVVFIHGGGFVGGSKRNLNPGLLELCLREGLSVAAINYRYSTQASYPAPMHDGARAIQFLRWKAKEWNLDPTRIAATGGSAGACMSLWIGFHDDLADAGSSDPVRRQSSRLAAMAVNGAQTVLDLRIIRDLVSEVTARHPAGPVLFGIRPEEVFTDKAARLYRDASPVTHLSTDDPPAYLYYSEPRGPVPPDAKPGTGIHHIQFGYYLKERMDKLRIECVVRHQDELGDDPMKKLHQEMVAFFRKHLR